jgi:membrane protein DedA with SNARE-associated domain
VSWPERIAQSFSVILERTGGAAPLVLFAATFIEHVFPPFPGDLLVVLGAWYAVHGQISWVAAFASVTAGAVAGAWVDYRIGAALGRGLEHRLSARHPALEAKLEKFEASYRRFGNWLLVLNRFFPGVRAFVFLAAGASGIPLRRVLVLGGLSAALWNALLLALGGLAARNVEELLELLRQYTRAAWMLLAAAALLALVVYALRRLRRTSPAPP